MHLLIVLVLSVALRVVSSQVGKEMDDYYKYLQLCQKSEYPSSSVFPYAVAILKKSAFHSSGVLLSDIWVLTGADALYTVRENYRVLQVRLGSTNYKEGGTLSSIKWYELHPFFDDQRPEFDIALIALAEVVNVSNLQKPIPMMTRLKPGHNVASHFTVPAWDILMEEDKENKHYIDEKGVVQRRTLHVSLIHPLDSKNCTEYLDTLVLQSRESLLCLESDPYLSDPCSRIPGAPVVVQGVLWGIISSWTPENCNSSPTPTLVNLVSSPHVGGWIKATMAGLQWNMTRNDYVIETDVIESTADDDGDYEEYTDIDNIV